MAHVKCIAPHKETFQTTGNDSKRVCRGHSYGNGPGPNHLSSSQELMYQLKNRHYSNTKKKNSDHFNKRKQKNKLHKCKNNGIIH